MSPLVGGQPARPDLPFRPFFILALLDAMLGVVTWMPASVGWGGLATIVDPAAWHARELLFGAFPAVLTGFLLTALPRWTGRGFGLPHLCAFLAAVWLPGPASSLLFPAGRPIAAAAYLAALTGVAGYQILKSGDRRNLKILLLVTLLACAATADLIAFPSASGLPFRMAIGAILGLVMVLAGRIIPSLTSVHLELQGEAGLPSSSQLVELVIAATALAALGAWIWSPDGLPAAGLCAAAAAGQAARCLRWQPWRTVARPAVFALHAAYACIPVGFALVSVRVLELAAVSYSAVLHVWAIGTIGLMSVAVMASMVRKHFGRPMTASPATEAVFALVVAALLLRAVAEFLPSVRDLMLSGAVVAWVAAQALFLVRFARELMFGRAGRAVAADGDDHRVNASLDQR